MGNVWWRVARLGKQLGKRTAAYDPEWDVRRNTTEPPKEGVSDIGKSAIRVNVVAVDEEEEYFKNFSGYPVLDRYSPCDESPFHTHQTGYKVAKYNSIGTRIRDWCMYCKHPLTWE